MIKDSTYNIVDLKSGNVDIPIVMSEDIIVWGELFIPRISVSPKYLFLGNEGAAQDVYVFSNVEWEVSVNNIL